MTLNRKIFPTESISTKFMLFVFFIYLVIALFATCGRIWVDSVETKKTVVESLVITQKAYERGLSRAIWFMDSGYLNATVAGIMENPHVAGIQIKGDKNQNFVFGKVPGGGDSIANGNAGKVSKETGKPSSSLKHEFFLVHQAEDDEIYHVGKVIFFTDKNIIFDKLRNKILLAVINFFILSISLGTIVYLIGRRIISKPLSQLTMFIERFDPERPEAFLDTALFKGKDELATVAYAFSEMQSRLRDTVLSLRNSQTELVALNNNLEKIVKRRTAKLTASNIQLKDEIYERKQAEEAVRREKTISEEYINSLPGLFYVFDENRFVKWNSEWNRITGYHDEELATKYGPDFFEGKDRIQIEDRMRKVFIEGSAEVEAELVTRDGRRIPYYFTGLRKELDGTAHLVGLGIDISERKQIETRLQQSHKLEAVGTLAGGIAHDFNNMLGVVSGNISYALSTISKEDGLFDVLIDVQKGAQQAQALTRQLLTFAKGGAPIKKTTDLNQIIEDSAKFVSRGEKSRCEFDLFSELWTVEVDPGQISQTISNLVINASQAMPEGGAILLKTENKIIEAENNMPLPPGQYVSITVEDQGVGIPRSHISKIFDPYFSTKKEGTGLGLATAYSIIKRHDGYTSVHSEIDRGTQFTIFLPASHKEVLKDEVIENISHQGRGKILIMDDQEPILKMVGRMLNYMGYDTEFTTDGFETIEIFRDAYHSGQPFDLVILDLTIPGGMGGAQTVPELLKIDSNAKAIVSSGYSNDPIMANFQDYGFCGVIPKPYTKQQISEVLNHIFSEKG